MVLGIIAGLIIALPILAVGIVPLFVVGDSIGVGVFGMFLCIALASGLPAFLIVYLIALAISGNSRSEESYQRQLLAQGTQQGFSQEFVQDELRRIGRVNKLRQAVLVLVIVLLSLFVCSFAFNVPRIFPDGINGSWDHRNWFYNAIEPTGPVVVDERELDLANIEIIDVHSAVSVEFKVSDRDYVTVETHEDMMPHIQTKVRSGTLLVKQDSRRYRNVKKLLVTVYSTNVPQLFQVSGASRLTCEEPIKVQSVSLYADGASNLNFKNIESTGSVNVKLTGASEVHIAGKASTSLIQMSGASKLHAKDFEVNRCESNLSGASNAEFGVIHEELSIRASGASHFDYWGTPAIKRQDVSGAAQLRAY
jgi:hypothetical protein